MTEEKMGMMCGHRIVADMEIGDHLPNKKAGSAASPYRFGKPPGLICRP